MGLVSFVLLNGLLGILSLTLARMLERREAGVQLLVALGLFPCLVLAAVVATGSVGLLSPPPLLLLLAPITLLTVVFGRRQDQPRQSMDRAPGSEAHLSVAILAGVLTPLVARSVLDRTRFDWDDLWYHAPAVAHWFVDRALSLAPADYQAYYPMNAETLSLWFVLPFGNDSHAGLAPLLWMAIASVSLALVARSLAGHAEAGYLAAALLASSPVLRDQVRSFSAPDLAGSAFVLAAAALTVQDLQDPEGGGWRSSLIGGLFAGFAVGCKTSFAPLLLVLVLVHALARARSTGQRWLRAATFAGGSVLTGAFWYARNLRIASNPLFPAEFGPFDGPFAHAFQARTTLARLIVDNLTTPSVLTEIARRWTSWPLALFVVAFSGYFFAVVLARRQEGRHERLIWILLAALGVLFALYSLFLPFSGTSDEGGLKVYRRYNSLLFALGIGLFAGSRPHDAGAGQLAWRAAAILGIASALPVFDVDGLLALLGAVVAALLVHLRARRLPGLWPGPKTAPVLTALLFLVLLGLWEPIKRSRTADHLFEDSYWSGGSGWRELDSLPTGSRVAWFGSEGRRYYPVFGRHYQLVPVAVLGDGTPFRPVHERWPDGGYTWWPPERRWGWSVETPAPVLLENLLASGVEYVFTSRGPGDPWPDQRELLLSAPDVETLFESDKAIILRLPTAAASLR